MAEDDKRSPPAELRNKEIIASAGEEAEKSIKGVGYERRKIKNINMNPNTNEAS